jgi:hypothetical protein
MTIGIKVGPQKQSLQDLIRTEAPFAEVWYRPDRPDDYTDLFKLAKSRNVALGLHHWAVTSGGYWPTLAYPDDPASEESEALIRLTIDHAARLGAAYVNIHPGARTKTPFDFAGRTFGEPSALLPPETAYPAVAAAVNRLDAYAKSGGVLLTVETVPPNSNADNAGYGKGGRVAAIADVSATDIADMIPGVALANDFCHTAAEVSALAGAVRTHLFETTRRLAPRTRLLHVGFNIEPFDGTDFHDTLANPVFLEPATVPNRDDMISLLGEFSGRRDVWALVEPETDHVGNYGILKELISASERSNYV